MQGQQSSYFKYVKGENIGSVERILSSNEFKEETDLVGRLGLQTIIVSKRKNIEIYCILLKLSVLKGLFLLF